MATSALITREQFAHTACYCEENVYRLVRQLSAQPCAMFISNPGRSVPVWCQRASDRPDGLVIWDYHVVAIDGAQNPPVVYDLDTRLDFPCSLAVYLERALRSNASTEAMAERSTGRRDRFHRRYRLVPGPDLLRHFASDRRHMRDPDSGAWRAPPPPAPCIRSPQAECEHNLPRYLDMAGPDSQPCKFGRLLSEAELLAHFGLAWP